MQSLLAPSLPNRSELLHLQEQAVRDAVMREVCMHVVRLTTRRLKHDVHISYAHMTGAKGSGRVNVRGFLRSEDM